MYDTTATMKRRKSCSNYLAFYALNCTLKMKKFPIISLLTT